MFARQTTTALFAVEMTGRARSAVIKSPSATNSIKELRVAVEKF